MKNSCSFILHVFLSCAFLIQPVLSARDVSVAINVFTSFNQTACAWLASKRIPGAYTQLPVILPKLSIEDKKELKKEIQKMLTLIKKHYKKESYINRLECFWRGCVLFPEKIQDRIYTKVFLKAYEDYKNRGQLENLNWKSINDSLFSIWSQEIEPIPVKAKLSAASLEASDPWKTKIKAIRADLSKPSYLLYSLSAERENMQIAWGNIIEKKREHVESVESFFQNVLTMMKKSTTFDESVTVDGFFKAFYQLSLDKLASTLQEISDYASIFLKNNPKLKNSIRVYFQRFKKLIYGNFEDIKTALRFEKILSENQQADIELEKSEYFCHIFHAQYQQYSRTSGRKFLIDVFRKTWGEETWNNINGVVPPSAAEYEKLKLASCHKLFFSEHINKRDLDRKKKRLNRIKRIYRTGNSNAKREKKPRHLVEKKLGFLNRNEEQLAESTIKDLGKNSPAFGKEIAKNPKRENDFEMEIEDENRLISSISPVKAYMPDEFFDLKQESVQKRKMSEECNF